MTIVNWQMSAERIVLFTDTLVTRGDTDLPERFVSKAAIVPHVGLVMIAYGWGDPMQVIWNAIMRDGFLPRDIDETAYFAHSLLNSPKAEFSPAFQGQLGICFVFGWSLGRGRLCGYRLSSAAGYVPEPIPDGIALNPPLESNQPLDWLGAAIAQQAAGTAGRDTFIGGCLIKTEISRMREADPLVICTANVGELPHYAEDRAACGRNG